MKALNTGRLRSGPAWPRVKAKRQLSIRRAGPITAALICSMLPGAQRARAVDTIQISGTAYQKFDGFGASQAFDCVALSHMAPSEATQNAYYDALFNDLNLSFFRVDLRSSFSPASGAYDYTTAVQASGQDTVIKAVRARKPNIKLMYTAWSPPAYMKDNNSVVGGHLLTSAYGSYAGYLAEFTRQFSVNESFPVDLLSLQNEPDLNVGYDCCIYDPATYNTVLGYVSPQVRSVASANGYTTKILGAEWSGSNSGSDPWFTTVTNVGTASAPVPNPNLDYSAMHSYWGTIGNLNATARGLMPVYETEFSDLTDGNTDSAPMAARTAAQFCMDFNYGNVGAWFWWWMSWVAGSGNEGQSLTLRAQDINETTPWTSYTLCKKYYAFKALTNVFLPGSVGRKATVSTGTTGQLQAAAALGPYGLFELAAVNASTSNHPAVQLTVTELAGTGNVNFTRILVDASNNYSTSTVTFVNGVYTENLPASTSCFYVQQDNGAGTLAPYSGGAAAIPGTISFPNYDLGGSGVAYHVTIPSNQGGQYRTDGVSIGTTADPGGIGYVVGWTTPGQWLKYTVNVASAGTYNVSVRAASPAGGSVHIEDAFGTNLTGPIAIPNTGSYTTFQAVTVPLALRAGTQVLRFVEDTGGYDLHYMTFALQSAGSVPPAPNGLTAVAGQWSMSANTAPGQVVLTWSAASGATSYSLYRSTTSGAETLYMPRIYSTHYTDVGLTNGVTYYYKVVAVNAFGTSALSGEVNGKPLAPVSTPYGGTAAAIPGTVYFPRYDAGGELIGYHDADAANQGGAYRTDAVDISAGGDPGGNGYCVGWCYAGEWLKYSVNVASAGTYTVSFRIANGTIANSTFHLEDNSHNNLSGTVTVAPTGGYGTYTTVTATVTLMAGAQVLKFVEDSGGYNISHMTFSGATSPPAAPTGLTATSGVSQVALTWTASPGATSYNVLRSTTSGGPYTSVATGLGSTSYTNTGLTNGSTYYYVVTATNSNGTSGNSSPANATPFANSLPIQINAGGSAASPYIADAYFSGGTAATNWTGAIDTSGVTNPASQGVYQDERWGPSTYTVAGLTPGTACTVRLHFCENYFTASGSRQFNASINGTQVLTNFDIYAAAGAAHKANVQQFSATVNGSGQIVVAFTNGAVNNALIDGIEIVSGGGGSAPSTPTGLTATAGNAQAALSWTASAGATSYNVLRSTTSSGTYASIATGLTSTSYTNTGLTNGSTYYYVVTATNASGTSGNSNQASATPTASTIPSSPTGVTAASLAGQVTISWTASSGATSYTVLRSQNYGTGYVSIASGITSTNYVDMQITNGLTYYYVVTATNSSGTSGNSSQVIGSPVNSGSAPGNVSSFTVTPSTGQVVLAWTVPGATSYSIARSTTSGYGYVTYVTGLTSGSYTDTNVIHGTTYYYIVYGANSSGTGPGSSQLGATP